MMKYFLNRLILRNRGFWINALNSNVTVWTNGTLLNPNLVGIEPRQSSYFRQIVGTVRKVTTDSNQIRQNYHEEAEDGVNKQINLELHSSYVYMTMSYHFHRDDQALYNISEYFKKFSDDEREHAMRLMKFQNQRGGTIILNDIKVPSKIKWKSPLEAMEDALELEKTVNQALLDLHKIATKYEDAQMTDFLEREYLTEQVECIKEIGDHVTNLKRVGTGLGEYLFDKEFK